MRQPNGINEDREVFGNMAARQQSDEFWQSLTVVAILLIVGRWPSDTQWRKPIALPHNNQGNSLMFRILSITITLATILSMSGCVLGPCGGGGNCNDCDGLAQNHLHCTPGDSFRAWRRSLTCSAGCGETYYDEWYSTPPDCVDPCPQMACAGGCGGACGGGCHDCGCSDGCGGACGGGGVGCGIRPLRAVTRLVTGLYGKRFCGACGYNFDDCCCGGSDAGYIEMGELPTGEYMDGGYIEGGPMMDGGFSSAPKRGTPMQRQVRRSPAYEQAMARQQSPRPQTNGTPERVVYPEDPNSNLYRQASRLPQRAATLR